MTNKYMIGIEGDYTLGLYADIMANTEEEALELGRKYLNDNHNLGLQPHEVEVANVERSWDGEHNVVILIGEGEWKRLFIDDEFVYADYTILASTLMKELVERCGGQFTFIEKTEGK